MRSSQGQGQSEEVSKALHPPLVSQTLLTLAFHLYRGISLRLVGGVGIVVRFGVHQGGWATASQE